MVIGAFKLHGDIVVPSQIEPRRQQVRIKALDFGQPVEQQVLVRAQRAVHAAVPVFSRCRPAVMQAPVHDGQRAALHEALLVGDIQHARVHRRIRAQPARTGIRGAGVVVAGAIPVRHTAKRWDSGARRRLIRRQEAA